MAIQKFEDIIAGQNVQDFSEEIYNTFQSSKDFGFKDQTVFGFCICKICGQPYFVGLQN